MKKLTTLAASLLATTGIIAATTSPATAADNGAGWATVAYNQSKGICELKFAPNSRAKAQVDELRRIYIKHFTDANTQMRQKVANDLGLTTSQINHRQYTDADAAKIGMTKAQLQALHDRLNRKGAIEFLIPTGASFFGNQEGEKTTAGQVKALRYDRENRLGRGVYWVTNDAGRVDYVPPQPVKDYFQKNLTGIYSQVLLDKQRGAEFSNDATGKCLESVKHGNKEFPVAIGLLGEIHKYNPGWKNPPTLQMIAAEKKKNNKQPIIIHPEPSNDSTFTADVNKSRNEAEQRAREAQDRRDRAEAARWARGYKTDEEKAFEKANRERRSRGIPTPMSLVGDDYISDPNAKVLPDGRVVFVSEDPHATPGGNGLSSSGMFGSS